MPRTIICTTGTSIVGGLPYDGDADGYRSQLRARLSDLRKQCPTDSDFLRKASAEVNSLAALGIRPDDRVVLLSTETADGLICAEEVKRLLEDQLATACQLLRIEGLQVTDPVRFRRVGVQNLFDVLDRYGGDLVPSGDEVMLNVTGGFKSVVPYVTLYGLLHQFPVVYLFERSHALLRLPPVPVDFDYERLSAAMDALQLLEHDVVPREKFFAAIPDLDYHRRDWYECLIEEDGGMVTVSAFGSLLLRRRQRDQAQVLLGPAAQRQYDSATGITKEQFTFMLERVADPLWRKGKIHSFPSTDLTVFKPGNTSERMAAIVHDGRIYVCELLRHDEYERLLPQRRASDYTLKDFRPWVRPADVPEPATTEAAAYESLRRQLDDAVEATQRADAAHEQTLAEIDTLAAGARAAELARDSAESAVAALRTENATLLSEIDQLRHALADARRPWWQRWFRRL